MLVALMTAPAAGWIPPDTPTLSYRHSNKHQLAPALDGSKIPVANRSGTNAHRQRNQAMDNLRPVLEKHPRLAEAFQAVYDAHSAASQS